MLRFILVALVACLTAFAVAAPCFAYQMEDVVHLKNGSVIRGTIIEQIPGESLKIQTAGGSVFVYTMDEIAEIGREPVMGTVESATGVEIGTLFGLSHLSDEDDGLTFIGVPTLSDFPSAALGNPSLYVSWFPSEQLALGPEFSLGRISLGIDEVDEDFTLTTLYLGGRGAFFPQGNAVSGPYLSGHVALGIVDDEDDSESEFSAGAGLGYRWHLGPAFVLRAEGRYRRWFDDEGPNDFSLLLGLGTRAGRIGSEKDAPAPEVEIGTLFGLSRLAADFPGENFLDDRGNITVTYTEIGVPGGLVYVSWFPNEQLALGPEFSLGSVQEDGGDFTSYYLGGRGALFLHGNGVSGPYLLGQGAVSGFSLSEQDESVTDTDFSAGAGLGYQWRLGPFVLRAEGRYQRWLGGAGNLVSAFADEDVDKNGANEFSLLVGLGTRLGGR